MVFSLLQDFICIHGQHRHHTPRGRRDSVVRLVRAYSQCTYVEAIQKWAVDPLWTIGVREQPMDVDLKFEEEVAEEEP
ncbi:hypothetical protein GW17_00041823 [Ensete ventricosum]|nr:hypothetical protein GW17_00041823 [Ensete ventricosum]